MRQACLMAPLARSQQAYSSTPLLMVAICFQRQAIAKLHLRLECLITSVVVLLILLALLTNAGDNLGGLRQRLNLLPGVSSSTARLLLALLAQFTSDPAVDPANAAAIATLTGRGNTVTFILEHHDDHPCLVPH